MRTVQVNPEVRLQAISVLLQILNRLVALGKGLGRAEGDQGDLQIRMRRQKVPGIDVCRGAAQRVTRDVDVRRARRHELGGPCVDEPSRPDEALVGFDVGATPRLDDIVVQIGVHVLLVGRAPECDDQRLGVVGDVRPLVDCRLRAGLLVVEGLESLRNFFSGAAKVGMVYASQIQLSFRSTWSAGVSGAASILGWK